MAGSVCIIDDEPNIRKTMMMIHRNRGWEAEEAANGSAGIALVQSRYFDLVYLDLAMPDMDGIEALKKIRLHRPGQLVVILTGHGSIEKAVEAIKLGAFDFLEKDCGKEKILLTSEHALEYRSITEENRKLRSRMRRRHRLIGRSGDIQNILKQVSKVAPTNATVLILGESGTGKELVAREIHRRSNRKERPFVRVNCAAIPEELIEAELFGSTRGAYTGSVVSREGKFKMADGGTIFLDEVGDMSLKVQTKVLRAIQEGEIERVGSDRTVSVDVRVIAATNKDLKAEITAGRFREDLFYRLNVVPLRVPPLRDHPEDIPLLSEVFIKEYCRENGLPSRKLDARVVQIMMEYPWPGNVRELRNQVERMVIMSSRRVMGVGDLSAEIRMGGRDLPKGKYSQAVPGENSCPEKRTGGEAGETEGYTDAGRDGSEVYRMLPLREAKIRLERDMIMETLDRHGWNVTRAAGELGIERTNLHKKIKKHNLTREG